MYALTGFSPADDCLRALRASADADASYARGQLINLATIAAVRVMPSVRTRVRSTGMSGHWGCSNAAVQIPRRRGPRRNTPQPYTACDVMRRRVSSAKRASAAFATAGGTMALDRAKAIEASSEMEVARFEPGRDISQSAAQARATEMLVHARALSTKSRRGTRREVSFLNRHSRSTISVSFLPGRL